MQNHGRLDSFIACDLDFSDLFAAVTIFKISMLRLRLQGKTQTHDTAWTVELG